MRILEQDPIVALSPWLLLENSWLHASWYVSLTKWPKTLVPWNINTRIINIPRKVGKLGLTSLIKAATCLEYFSLYDELFCLVCQSSVCPCFLSVFLPNSLSLYSNVSFIFLYFYLLVLFWIIFIIYLFVHSFIHSFIRRYIYHPLPILLSVHYLFIDLSINRLIFLPSLNQSINHSIIHRYPFIHSFIRSFMHACIHLFIQSINQPPNLSFIHSFIHSLTHSLAYSLLSPNIFFISYFVTFFFQYKLLWKLFDNNTFLACYVSFCFLSYSTFVCCKCNVIAANHNFDIFLLSLGYRKRIQKHSGVLLVGCNYHDNGWVRWCDSKNSPGKSNWHRLRLRGCSHCCTSSFCYW